MKRPKSIGTGAQVEWSNELQSMLVVERVIRPRALAQVAKVRTLLKMVSRSVGS